VLTIAAVTDLHFGPRASHAGKLRKLSDLAPELVQRFAAFARQCRPDVVVNLGDVIEDEGPELDLARYQRGIGLLDGLPGQLVHVAGNHDLINLRAPDLRRSWGLEPQGPLHRSFDVAGHHVAVVHTVERRDVDVRIEAAELAWLQADLAATDLPTVVLMHHSAAEQDLADNRWFSQAPELALVHERRDLRAILEAAGRTVLVLNGHLHWNHVAIIRGIPYVTLQSLTENVEQDAPGRPAACWALVRLSDEGVRVRVLGAEPARFELRR
jgi:3',5'-cyclic AMP phosphodiesterase CpdA